jgi:hypothetical protein
MGATVRTLLENALYLSVADREFSPVEPDGSQINVALNRLVDALDTFRDQVPYYDERIINGEAELLNINASAINFVDYLLGNVIYNMEGLTQIEFSRVAVITDLRAIPSYYWLDEANNALRVYPLPQTTSDIFIIGFKPILTVTTLDESLPTGLTPFMKLFLEYEIAKGMCDIYTVPWSQQKEVSRMSYYNKLLQNSQNMISEPDKPNLRNQGVPVPWLAYLSGNTPGS